jgi:hypothetical protein
MYIYIFENHAWKCTYNVASIIASESNRWPHNWNRIVRCQEIPTPNNQKGTRRSAKEGQQLPVSSAPSVLHTRHQLLDNRAILTFRQSVASYHKKIAILCREGDRDPVLQTQFFQISQNPKIHKVHDATAIANSEGPQAYQREKAQHLTLNLTI